MSWRESTIGESCTLSSGGTPSKAVKKYWTGAIPWVSGRDMKSDRISDAALHISKSAVEESATRIAPVGALLILVRGMGLANGIPVAEVKAPCAFNQDIRAIYPPRHIDPRFLMFALRCPNSPLNQIRTNAAHGTLKIDTDALRSIRFPVPPLAEQRRIVGILDEAFAGIARALAATEKNLANARELFESYRERLFGSKGDDWRECRLHELIEIKHGFAFKSEYFSDEGDYVLLTPGNFHEEGGYRDRGDKQKYYVGEIPEGYLLQKDAFLIAMTEQAAGLLGSSIIVPADNKFLHNQRLGLVVPKPGVAWCNEFFFHTFNTKRFRKAVHDGASGVKVRHTSPQKLGNVVVSFPAMVAEQSRVATRLERIRVETQRLESLYRRKLAALLELKQSILQKAFAGELTGEEAVGCRP